MAGHIPSYLPAKVGIYSYLSESAGLIKATRTDCQETVIKAMARDNPNTSANIQTVISTRYWKFCSHLSIAYQASGQAIRFEMMTHLENSFINR